MSVTLMDVFSSFNETLPESYAMSVMFHSATVLSSDRL